MRALMLPIPLMLFFTSIHAEANSGYYLLEAMNSHKCAHVQAALQDDGATISQWQCRDQKTLDLPLYFQWDKVNVGGEYFMLRAKHSGKCAQVNGASNENGARVTQWDCQRDRAHFHWKLAAAEKRAGDTYYYLVNRASGKCMHIHGGGSEDGALITQWDCVSQSNLKWMVIHRVPID